MIRNVTVAAVQLRAHDRHDFLPAVESVMRAVEDASDADVIVLPEGTFPAYVLGSSALESEAIARALDRLRGFARATKTVVVVGSADATDGPVTNSAFVIDADGSLAGRADKLFLWHFDRRWFKRGARLEPIETTLGPLGVLICADGRLPTLARTLVDRGAQALIMPTAWVTSGRDPERLENVQADLLARVRAYENGVPFVAANKCGTELGAVAYCGKSQIVASDGEIVAMASEREAETVFATVAIGAPPRSRSVGVSPSTRDAAGDRPLRLAISFDPLPNDVDALLELLDDAYALAPGDALRLGALDAALPVASVSDELVLDPGGLVGYRRAGYAVLCWTTSLSAPWLDRIARARALELRLYLIVFDRSARRAFAVDPDGAIVAGTFGGYRLASFVLDPRKAAETLVAPGTDVRDGLERVIEVAERGERAAT